MTTHTTPWIYKLEWAMCMKGQLYFWIMSGEYNFRQLKRHFANALLLLNAIWTHAVSKMGLIHLPLVPHLCIGKQGQQCSAPSPESTLRSCQLGTWEQTVKKFESKYVFIKKKCIWKCSLRNGGHFVQGEMSYVFKKCCFLLKMCFKGVHPSRI